jgi:subtilisin family serine protease
MRPVQSWNRYILLPEEGAISASREASRLLEQLPYARSVGEPESASLEFAEGRDVTVIDTTSQDGPRLVEADFKVAEMVNRGDSPLRMVPVVEFEPPDPQVRIAAETAAGGASGSGPPAPKVPVKFTCTAEGAGTPIEGARFIAITDAVRGRGAEGETDTAGKVTLQIEGTYIDQLYVYPPDIGPAYWGCYRYEFNTSGTEEVALRAIDLSYVDCVRHYYGSSRFEAAREVLVGIIDTGIGPHDDLNVVGGVNTVTGEPAGEYRDLRGHGTHVAGLVGSNGRPPHGLRGLAPGVKLRAYRVFPKDSPYATNYSIQKAMARAAIDGCDVINLSLGGGPHDPAVEEAVIDARNAGMLVVVSAGNDSRFPASFPSVYPEATAVSAMGRRGTFPDGSVEEADVAQLPLGKDRAAFLAAFSNVGQEVSVTAPGVGDLSTLPGNRFGSLSGTSMAAPVISGVVACLLSRDAGVFEMARDGARSKAIEGLLLATCVPLEFGAIYEGKGMPDPALV